MIDWSTERSVQWLLDYFSNKLSELGNDQKQLQRPTNNLMGKTNEVVLQMHENSHDLSSKFNTFFINKIKRFGMILVLRHGFAVINVIFFVQTLNGKVMLLPFYHQPLLRK